MPNPITLPELVAFKAKLLPEVRHNSGSDGSGACFTWSHLLILELRALGYSAIFQAGDCFWPRLTQEQYENQNADERDFVQFGYAWDPLSLPTRMSVILGQLPECHVWVATVDTKQLIDLTSGFFEPRCRDILKRDWRCTLPPDILLANSAADIPENVIYRALEPACVFAAVCSGIMYERNSPRTMRSYRPAEVGKALRFVTERFGTGRSDETETLAHD